jgi:hypothetical protein
VAHAISSLYENVIGQAWMVAAILVAGIWGIWKALVQRRYTETAAALSLSVVFVLIALFFVYQPERTIGQASQWTTTLSLAFLSGANRGTVDDPGAAKRQVADELFGAQIYQPWVVLEFGGLSHCVDTDKTDEDGFPGAGRTARSGPGRVPRSRPPRRRRARRLREPFPRARAGLEGAQRRVRGVEERRDPGGRPAVRRLRGRPQ